MKRLLSFAIICLFALSANAQLFTTMRKVDKFDDVISEKTIKTLIDFDQESKKITIETKGSKPVVHYVILDPTHNGSKEEPVQLTSDFFGYETQFLCIQHDAIGEIAKDYEAIKDNLNKDNLTELFKKYNISVITRRIITDKITHEYKTCVVWVEDIDKNRVIYFQ